MKTAAVAVLVSASALLSGCVSYQIPRYSISTDNVAALKAAGKQKVAVGEFQAETVEDGKVGVRACKGGGWLKTEDGKPFADYLRRALISDLSLADRYDPQSPVVITGALTEIGIDYQKTTLRVSASLASTAGRSGFSVVERKVTGSFDPDLTCRNMKDALIPAVQDIVGDLARTPVLAD